jgi:hypothetical protein
VQAGLVSKSINTMTKPKKPLKKPEKSNSQRIVETLLIFAPAPIRQIASSPLGSRILLTVGAGLLATGAMSVHWENGMPSLTFHKDKIGDATQQVKDELNKQGIQWTTNSQGVVFSGDGQQVPVPIQSLPGFQVSYQNDLPYPQNAQGFQPPPAWQPPPQQYYPPQNFPPQNFPPQNYPPAGYNPQGYPPGNLPPQNGQILPPGYGYGQAQGQSLPPGYFR